jgi:phospholipid/cholesterol/gamma-HCH transport system ATP-binding protein
MTTASPNQSAQNPPAAASLLRFENVTISFDEVVAVDNVSFEMSAGETRVVLGSAGSGKTTLLKAAIGLIRIDSGRIFLLGRDITNLAERQLFDIRSQVGVLFQEGGLFDSITIAENVAYPLVNRKTNQLSPAEVETKVEDALRFVELSHTLDKYPNELSGGMRRRVGIARAVITEPPLVLYDSPTPSWPSSPRNAILSMPPTSSLPSVFRTGN